MIIDSTINRNIIDVSEQVELMRFIKINDKLFVRDEEDQY